MRILLGKAKLMTKARTMLFVFVAVILTAWSTSPGWAQTPPGSLMLAQSDTTGQPGSSGEREWTPEQNQVSQPSSAQPSPTVGMDQDTSATRGTTDTSSAAEATRADGTSTGTGMTGGFGGAGLDGLIAGSPRFAASDLGLDTGITYMTRLSQEIADVLLLSLDFTGGHFRGSTNYPGGTITALNSMPLLAKGDRIDTQFDIELLSLVADLDVASFFGEPPRTLSAGPRLQWLNYRTSLLIDNFTLNLSHSGGVRHRVLGFGGFIKATWYSPEATWYFVYGGLRRPLIPSIKFAACYGNDDSLEYCQWELFVRVETPGGWLRKSILGCDVWISSVYGEVGYVRYNFAESTETLSGFVALGASYPVRGNADFSFAGIIARAAVEF